MGIILEKQERDATQEFIDLSISLQGIGVDVRKIKQKDTIETLAKKSGISKEEVEKIGLNSKQKIGNKLEHIKRLYKGSRNGKKLTEEQVKELEKLGISLEPKKRTTKEIVQASIESLTDIEMADREDAALKELIQKEKTTNKAK